MKNLHVKQFEEIETIMLKQYPWVLWEKILQEFLFVSALR